ncbi:MAG: OmpA family protein [Burkholderiaceae bacterium]
MRHQLALGLVLGCVSAAVLAQATTSIQAPPAASAYAGNGNGAIMRSGDGLCWRTGYWTPDDAVTGCDGQLTPPIAKPTAPPIVTTPSTATQTSVPAPTAAAPARCDFTATLAGDDMFGFDQAKLSTSAKNRLDTEILPRIQSCAVIDALVVSGHTDRLGTPAYNVKLSQQRADAVASYLKDHAISSPIESQGLADRQALQVCDGRLKGKKLRDCLAPNRRVEIVVRGMGK